jgi:hypothetical protein
MRIRIVESSIYINVVMSIARAPWKITNETDFQVNVKSQRVRFLPFDVG